MKPSYDNNEQNIKLTCTKCDKPAMLRCSMCKKFVLCNQKVHEK